MNTNLLHNIINVSMAVIAGLQALDWTAFVSPETSVTIVGVLAVLKLTINLWRDGLSGLIKDQPPVQ